MLVFAALVGVIACIGRLFHRSGALLPFLYGGLRVHRAIGLGAFFFVMVQYLTGSAWSVTMRRIMENIMIDAAGGAAAVHSGRVRAEVTSIPGRIRRLVAPMPCCKRKPVI